MNDKEHCTDAKAVLTRRTILKLIAGAPLVATFGLLASPFLRFLRPTLKPLDIVGQSDQPLAEPPIPTFIDKDFPAPWTCLPFTFYQKYLEYNPELAEVRTTPGFIMRTAKNEIVAFSRICTQCRHQQPVNFLRDTHEHNCITQSKTPVLCCPCDCSTFDPNDNGRVLGGPASRPLRRMTVAFDGEYYTITGLEQNGIA
ncbi:MAG: Rieske 2Fe-2S domain-containing protein [Candidatus Melainabacteria bacterium]|nr:Rieske 2Fe-2S domain-containing protein [Candidatus Melainabacteria bacterium]